MLVSTFIQLTQKDQSILQEWSWKRPSRFAYTSMVNTIYEYMGRRLQDYTIKGNL